MGGVCTCCDDTTPIRTKIWFEILQRLAHLPERQQAAAPFDHVGVGRVLQLQVERVREGPPRALRAERVAVQDRVARLLRRKLPAKI